MTRYSETVYIEVEKRFDIVNGIKLKWRANYPHNGYVKNTGLERLVMSSYCLRVAT